MLAKNLLHKRKALIGILVVSALIIFSLWYLTPVIIQNNQDGAQNSAAQKANPFANIKDAKSMLFNEMEKVYGADRSYWDGWDFNNKLVFAYIEEIDLENEELLVDIGPPHYEKFSYGTQRIYVACPENNTISVRSSNPTKSVVDENFSVIDRAQVGDLLLGFCSDEECLNIGGACALIVD